MLTSFSEFKFYQSFRIPVEEADELRCLVEIEDELGHRSYIEDAKLLDISINGLGISTKSRVPIETDVCLSLQFKKNHLDLTGKTVRAFSDNIEDDLLIYGIEIDEEKKLVKFLEQYVLSFSPARLRDCLIESALEERYTKASDGFEMFSLLLSLFKDITNFSDREGFIETMLDEVVRILNASRASIFLINPEVNELEAVTATGINKDYLKFDYRLGIAGSVFTTGIALNIDTNQDKTRFNDDFDNKYGFHTTSIICYPIHNREDKIVGVIEVLNKKNQDRFTIEDEKTMKVLSLVFSSLFHSFDPVDVTSNIRSFNKPSARKFALIGKSAHAASLRSTITKIKDLDDNVLIYGETGVGKKLIGRVIHNEGSRGLKEFAVIDCRLKDQAKLENELLGPVAEKCKLVTSQGGTVILEEVSALSTELQEKLLDVIVSREIGMTKYSLDVRIIATSTVDLAEMVENGSFNRDLFKSLSRIYIHVEGLRRRQEDIKLLIDYFLKDECGKQGLLLKVLDDQAIKKLVDYDWPGNIQELRTSIERIVLYNPKSHIIHDYMLEDSSLPSFDVNVKKRRFGDLPYVSDFNISLKDRLAIVEREMIFGEIKRHNGNKTKAAQAMGISREALRKKLLASDKVLDTQQTRTIELQKKKEAA